MLEQLKLLVKLQEVDKTLYDLGLEMVLIPQRLEELNRAEETLILAINQHKEALDELGRRRKALETENDDVRARLRKAETRLMSSKNQREYRAATAEIQEGKDAIKANDDNLVGIMEQQEGLESKIKDLESRLAEITNDSEEQKQELNRRNQEIETQVGKLEANRQGLTGGVELELLDRYDFIRKNREGVALAPVSQGVCGVCHMRIPPQQFNELQRMDRIMDCPTCRRLIYWADSEKLGEDQ